MLRSCQYCGRIHQKGVICPRKPKHGRHRRDSKAAAFRKTYQWQRRSREIMERDFFLCRLCNEGSYGVYGVPGLERMLQVHHIEPLEENFDLRVEEENLITCCTTHHELAERGVIPREFLHRLTRIPPRWD